jgi:hypothetical protein
MRELSPQKRNLLAHWALVKQKLPSFMTDRPACAAVWVQLIKGDLRSGREFFHFSTGGVGPTEENGVLTDKGRRYKAGRELTSWVRETRNYLGRFDTSGSHSATYAGLSQRLRKFYHELRETAMLVGQNGWRYGFLFIVSTSFASSQEKRSQDQKHPD